MSFIQALDVYGPIVLFLLAVTPGTVWLAFVCLNEEEWQ